MTAIGLSSAHITVAIFSTVSICSNKLPAASTQPLYWPTQSSHSTRLNQMRFPLPSGVSSPPERAIALYAGKASSPASPVKRKSTLPCLEPDVIEEGRTPEPVPFPLGDRQCLDHLAGKCILPAWGTVPGAVGAQAFPEKEAKLAPNVDG